MGLVFAAIGSASGVLSKPLEVSIIIMVISMTFLAPPVLRIVFGNSTESNITVDS